LNLSLNQAVSIIIDLLALTLRISFAWPTTACHDWRLPSKDELMGLIVESVIPTIDGTWFPNTQTSWYWTGTDTAGSAWIVYFGNGYVGYYRRYNYGHVRLVH